MGVNAEELGEDAAVRVRAFRLLLVTSQRMRTVLDQVLQREGFTIQQTYVFSAVDSMGTPRLTELAAAIGMTHQNLRQIVSSLERKGMLEVTPDPDDGRARRVAVTEAGRRHWEDRPGTGHAEVLDWFGDLDPGEAATFLALLGRVNRRIG